MRVVGDQMVIPGSRGRPVPASHMDDPDTGWDPGQGSSSSQILAVFDQLLRSGCAPFPMQALYYLGLSRRCDPAIKYGFSLADVPGDRGGEEITQNACVQRSMAHQYGGQETAEVRFVSLCYSCELPNQFFKRATFLDARISTPFPRIIAGNDIAHIH